MKSIQTQSLSLLLFSAVIVYVIYKIRKIKYHFSRTIRNLAILMLLVNFLVKYIYIN